MGQRQHSEQRPEGGHHWQLRSRGRADPRRRAAAGRCDHGSMQCDFPVIKELGLVVTVVDGGLTDP